MRTDNAVTTKAAVEKMPCTMPGCDGRSKGKGLCQRHYDQWYGRIRRERDKLQRRGKPFLKFPNPYREGSGYHFIFEVLRQNPPLTTDQIIYRSKIELAKNGLADYRIDYAFEVLRMKKHACKRGDYQMRRDAKGCWHLIRERGGKDASDGQNP